MIDPSWRSSENLQKNMVCMPESDYAQLPADSLAIVVKHAGMYIIFYILNGVTINRNTAPGNNNLTVVVSVSNHRQKNAVHPQQANGIALIVCAVLARFGVAGT